MDYHQTVLKHSLDWRSIRLDGEPERLKSLEKCFLLLKGGVRVAAWIKGKSEQEQWEVEMERYRQFCGTAERKVFPSTSHAQQWKATAGRDGK